MFYSQIFEHQALYPLELLYCVFKNLPTGERLWNGETRMIGAGVLPSCGDCCVTSVLNLQGMKEAALIGHDLNRL